MIKNVKNKFSYHLGNHGQLFKNMSWLFVAEIGSRIARGALAILAARMLGASDFGSFTYILALGGILTIFEDAGIGMFITRELSKENKDRKSIISTALSLKLILLFLSIVLFLIVGSVITKDSGNSNLLILMTAIILIADSAQSFFASIIRSEQKMYKESVMKTFSSILIFGLGLMFIIIKPDALSLAYGYAIGGTFGALIGFIYVRKYFSIKILSWIKEYRKKIFISSWPYTIISISSLMIMNIDTIFLGQYTNNTEVGIYSASNRLMQIIYVIPHLVTASIFPNLVKKLSENRSVNMTIKFSLISLFTLSSVCVALTFLLSPTIIPWLFGSEYVASVKIFLILSIASFPVFIGQLFQSIIFALDKQKYFVVVHIVGFIINIILNIFLIPKYSGVGAAVATVISLFLIHGSVGLLLFRVMKRKQSVENVSPLPLN